jgi:hypothetical protein
MKTKVSLTLVAFSLLALSAAPSAPTWSSGSLEEALAKAKAGGKLLILDFFQEYG